MRESKVQAYLKAQVERQGGVFRKLKWENRSHAPDCFIALNGVWLVEVKAAGKIARPGQAREIAVLVNNGVRCFVLNSIEAVDVFMGEVLDPNTIRGTFEGVPYVAKIGRG